MSVIQVGQPVSIDAPIPVRPRFGLLDVAKILPPAGDSHWQMGASVFAYPATLPSVDVPCGYGSAQDTKDSGDEGTVNPDVGPFSVYLPLICSTFSRADQDWFRQRATALLEAREDWAVEREFAGGNEAPDNQFLGKTGLTLLNSGAPTAAKRALALLENALAGTASDGVIHADPATATYWAADSLIVRDGAIMRTSAKGTPVAVGSGYQGVSVAGGGAPTDDRSWAFATGPIEILRSQVDLPGSIGQTTNLVEVRAERTYLINWDAAFRRAVLVDRTL